MKKTFILFFCITCVACSPTRFFYFPNKHLYRDPEKMDLPYDLVAYPSFNGKILYSLYFKTKFPPKGTVVHLHGNFGNVSNHFLQSQFLVNYGYDVLVVDYQGFGASQGAPSPKKTIEDGLASTKWAHDYARDPQQSVFLFGQSLGAAVATVVAAQDKQVKAVVLEAGFSSYRTMARVVIKKNAILWILYPIYPFLVGTAADPIKHIADISPRPILILHGDKDEIVPVENSPKLFAAAQEPKHIKIVPNARHLQLRKMGKENYERFIADFFDSVK